MQALQTRHQQLLCRHPWHPCEVGRAACWGPGSWQSARVWLWRRVSCNWEEEEAEELSQRGTSVLSLDDGAEFDPHRNTRRECF